MANRTLFFVAGTIALLGVQGLMLYIFGQPAICECGFVKVWEGVVASIGNSQHLSDWYTFSHVIHGFLFYLVLWYFFPRMSLTQRLFLAVGIEAAWEIIENTPMVIEHYRQQALAAGYVGDSILNSILDTIAMIVGFFFAWKAPVRVSVAIAVALEVWVGYSIRDGLTLNVLNFLHQFELVKDWQSGT